MREKFRFESSLVQSLRDRLSRIAAPEELLRSIHRRLSGLGPLPRRAAVGNGSRGLLLVRRLLELPAPRSRQEPGLPLGRGRVAGHHRPAGPALLRPRALERARPDPQGAPLRSRRPRGQPRRGREGAVLLPRLDSHALLPQGALQVSPGGVPLRAPGPSEPRARQGRSRVRTARHRCVRGPPLLRRLRRVRQGRCGRHPRPDHRGEPRARDRDAAPAPDALVPQHLELGSRGRRLLAEARAPPGRPRQDRGGARVARRLRPGRRAARRSAPSSTGCSPAASRRPTSSTRSAFRRG